MRKEIKKEPLFLTIVRVLKEAIGEKGDPLVEAIKEAFRYAVFLFVSGFVSYLLKALKGIEPQGGLIIALTLILRVIDKYLHEARKNKGLHFISKPSGLLPF